jgi:ribose transport system permease protein
MTHESAASPAVHAQSAAADSSWARPGPLVEILRRLRLGRFSGLGVWALFIVVFGLWVPDLFLTDSTVKTVLASQAITAILALAVVAPLACGVFDLSSAQLLGACALVCGALMSRAPHLSPVWAIIVTLGFGAAAGMANGALVAGVGVNSFIATLGTSSLLIALVQGIGGGDYVGPFPESFTQIVAFQVLGVPAVAVYLLVIAVAAWYVLEHTPIGRKTHATGANSEAARLAGVRTRTYVFTAFVVSGVGAAIAGILLAATVNSVNETTGGGYLLPAYAAAFLGTTQVKPGRFNVWGTLLAIYMLGTGIQGLQLVGGQQWVTNVFNGVALIGAVSFAIVLERRRGRRETRRRRASLAGTTDG